MAATDLTMKEKTKPLVVRYGVQPPMPNETPICRVMIDSRHFSLIVAGLMPFIILPYEQRFAIGHCIRIFEEYVTSDGTKRLTGNRIMARISCQFGKEAQDAIGGECPLKTGFTILGLVIDGAPDAIAKAHNEEPASRGFA